MFERVLVCLDGSHYAEQIIPYAEDEALVHQGQLVLLRVVHKPDFAVVESGATYREINELAEREEEDTQAAHSYLNEMYNAFRNKSVPVEVIVLEAADVGKAIVNYAENNSIGLIALATHGHSDIVQMFIGSIAEYVLRNSGLPLLIIRPK